MNSHENDEDCNEFLDRELKSNEEESNACNEISNQNASEEINYSKFLLLDAVKKKEKTIENLKKNEFNHQKEKSKGANNLTIDTIKIMQAINLISSTTKLNCSEIMQLELARKLKLEQEKLKQIKSKY